MNNKKKIHKEKQKKNTTQKADVSLEGQIRNKGNGPGVRNTYKEGEVG